VKIVQYKDRLSANGIISMIQADGGSARITCSFSQPEEVHEHVIEIDRSDGIPTFLFKDNWIIRFDDGRYFWVENEKELEQIFRDEAVEFGIE
jgi:hypothetical protein